jgi:hypothetical protein
MGWWFSSAVLLELLNRQLKVPNDLDDFMQAYRKDTINGAAGNAGTLGAEQVANGRIRLIAKK